MFSPDAAPRAAKNGAPEEIRTPDPQIRSLVLDPAELRARIEAKGAEPIEDIPQRQARALAPRDLAPLSPKSAISRRQIPAKSPRRLCKTAKAGLDALVRPPRPR